MVFLVTIVQEDDVVVVVTTRAVIIINFHIFLDSVSASSSKFFLPLSLSLSHFYHHFVPSSQPHPWVKCLFLSPDDHDYLVSSSSSSPTIIIIISCFLSCLSLFSFVLPLLVLHSLTHLKKIFCPKTLSFTSRQVRLKCKGILFSPGVSRGYKLYFLEASLKVSCLILQYLNSGGTLCHLFFLKIDHENHYLDTLYACCSSEIFVKNSVHDIHNTLRERRGCISWSRSLMTTATGSKKKE